VTTAFQPNAFQGYAFQVDPVTGSIYVIDNNDVATLIGSVTGGGDNFDMHDGGVKRRKHLAAVEAKLQKIINDKNERRRLTLQKQIDPESLVKVKLVEVESKQASASPRFDSEKYIAELELQRLQLLRKIALDEGQRQFDAYMAKLKADYYQNIEDEETLLMLL
jgi:hypothetical protein